MDFKRIFNTAMFEKHDWLYRTLCCRPKHGKSVSSTIFYWNDTLLIKHLTYCTYYLFCKGQKFIVYIIATENMQLLTFQVIGCHWCEGCTKLVWLINKYGIVRKGSTGGKVRAFIVDECFRNCLERDFNLSLFVGEG